MVDKNIAVSMFENGETLIAIGKLFGVSRQRIGQVVKNTGAKRKIRKNPQQDRVYKKMSPSPSEVWVAEKLRRLGFEVEHMPYVYEYDLLVNKKIRVEVKHAKNPYEIRGHSKYYQFLIYGQSDFVIALAGELENVIPYIFRRDEVGKFLYIAEVPVKKSKRLFKAKNNWSKIR